MEKKEKRNQIYLDLTPEEAEKLTLVNKKYFHNALSNRKLAMILLAEILDQKLTEKK